MRPPRAAPLAAVAIFCLTAAGAATVAHAAISSGTVASPAGGNGHNVSFDGKIYVVTRGGAQGTGWYASVLRPQGVVTGGTLPDVTNAFSPWVQVHDESNNENALSLCEETPQPSLCDAGGAPSAMGDHACYDLVVFDSDALLPKPTNVLRRRKLKLIVENPGTASAAITSSTWTDPNLTPVSPTLRGIETSVTKDGKLLLWQGRPDNSGDIDTLVYSYNATACGASGWSAPKSLSSMNTDANIVGKYKLGERPLRAADGAVFAPGALVYGAYPWVFPSGEAVNFTAVNMPCRATNDPAGCGPRRNALSVLGYVTNWTLSHIDGDVNPDTDQTVRLFFTSPGPTAAMPLPFTKGIDVWPFFGSNTSNYAELIFDDALDGNYAGAWHMNELVTAAGAFDLSRSADSSGYANTAKLRGAASFPAKNNGQIGKAVILNGSDARLEVAHAASLVPVNQITVEMTVQPSLEPNCDGNNNYRVLLQKGQGYSLLLEEDLQLHGRVRVAGGAIREILSMQAIPLGGWSKVAFEYDAATGTMATYIDGVETNRLTFPPALLEGTSDVLTIGGPNGARAACPNGDGAFAGLVDDVAISRVWRYGTLPPGPDMAGTAVTDAATSGNTDGGSSVDAGAQVPPGMDAGTEISQSQGCSYAPSSVSAQNLGTSLFLLLVAALALFRRRRTS